MTSFSGSVAYIEYQAAVTKGGVTVGDAFNSAFALGEMTDARVAYTSPVVIEDVANGAKSSLKVVGEVKVISGTGAVATEGENKGYFVATSAAKIAYKTAEFQMETTPAEQIPSIKPVLKRIALTAEPRRIAVKYDQITAYQAKTDYGFSLDKQIAEQACGELAYEIDTEIVDMLYNGAKAEGNEITWSKALPVGVSKFEHYNGFLEVIGDAKATVYKRTGKFHPNYMVIGAKVLNVLRFVEGFTAVKNAKMNGPYKVGEIDGLSVYVSPKLGDWEFFFGLNGNDMMSSAGVYAPYMAIVPTQLLGMPDGSLQQGFSTYYAKALLNKNLLVAGKIVDVA